MDKLNLKKGWEKLADFVQTIPKPIGMSGFMSILLLELSVLNAHRIPENAINLKALFFGVEAVTASIVASVLFYIIVVHYKEFKDKQITEPLITAWSKKIVAACETQIRGLSNNTLHLESLTAQQITSSVGSKSPIGEAPMVAIRNGVTVPYNWVEYFLEQRELTKIAYKRIMLQIIYVDSDLIGLISDIEESSFFWRLNTPQVLLTAPSFRVLGIDKVFWEYCQKCLALKKRIS